MEITLEELKGFFDLDSGGMSIYLDANVHRTVYNCQVCYSMVLGGYIRNHVEWHLQHKRPDSSKTPAEIRAEARRELGAIQHETK